MKIATKDLEAAVAEARDLGPSYGMFYGPHTWEQICEAILSAVAQSRLDRGQVRVEFGPFPTETAATRWLLGLSHTSDDLDATIKVT